MLPNGGDHSNFSVANSHDGSTQLVKRILNDSVNQVLSISITSIKTLEAQIKEFNKAIAAQIKLIPNVLIFIPCSGPVYSASIMAEIIYISIAIVLKTMHNSLNTLA